VTRGAKSARNSRGRVAAVAAAAPFLEEEEDAGDEAATTQAAIAAAVAALALATNTTALAPSAVEEEDDEAGELSLGAPFSPRSSSWSTPCSFRSGTSAMRPSQAAIAGSITSVLRPGDCHVFFFFFFL
jgi:hypothetical protein